MVGKGLSTKEPIGGNGTTLYRDCAGGHRALHLPEAIEQVLFVK